MSERTERVSSKTEAASKRKGTSKSPRSAQGEAKPVVHEPKLSPDIRESALTRNIEETTARIPSVSYLSLAFAAMGLSAATTFIYKRRMLGTFFGLWVPTFMLVGVYNKLVKIESGLNRKLSADSAGAE